MALSRKRCTSSSASAVRTNCTAAPVRGCVRAKMRASVRSGQLATNTRTDIVAAKRSAGVSNAGQGNVAKARRLPGLSVKLPSTASLALGRRPSSGSGNCSCSPAAMKTSLSAQKTTELRMRAPLRPTTMARVGRGGNSAGAMRERLEAAKARPWPGRCSTRTCPDTARTIAHRGSTLARTCGVTLTASV